MSRSASTDDGTYDQPEYNSVDTQRTHRSNTQDSEDMALSNGRKTLEEVAARLNDIDDSDKPTVSGGKGLISEYRIPFLSNLFNYRTYNGDILVDEEDANQEDNPVADIFLWRFPVVSAIWFIVLQVGFFLSHFCDYSLLTIAAFLGLWQLIVDRIIYTAAPTMKKMGVLSDDTDITDIIRKNTFFNDKFIKRVASASHELSDITIGLWRVTVFEANLSRVLIVGRFVFVVFMRSFSVITTAYLLLVILFTIPISYSRNQALANVVADGAHVAATRRFRRLRLFFKKIIDTVEGRAKAQSDNVNNGPANTRPMRELTAKMWNFLLISVIRINSFVDKLID